MCIVGLWPTILGSLTYILLQCFASDTSGTQLASFVPPPVLASPPLPDPVLTVFPDGTECFDHILVSALIIERKLNASF